MTKTVHDSETPAHGQQVVVAGAFIHHDFDGVTKVYLAKRAATKKFCPNLYELLGGHINFGEDVVEGLMREIQEELGKDVVVGDPFSVFTYINGIKGAHVIEITYFAQFVGGPGGIVLHPEDHSDGRWFGKNEEADIVAGRTPDDPTPTIIRRGFALLEGDGLKF